MNVGLDTSVILRFLTGEPERQARSAFAELEALAKSGGTALVSVLVVSEVYFALQYHYGAENTRSAGQVLTFGKGASPSTRPMQVQSPGHLPCPLHQSIRVMYSGVTDISTTISPESIHI